MAVTPDGRRAVSASEDKTLKVWDLEQGKCLATFSIDDSMYACVAALDGLTLVAGDKSGRIQCLRLEGVEPGPTLVTAWRAPACPPSLWTLESAPTAESGRKSRQTALGVEFPCPKCSRVLKFQPLYRRQPG